MIRSVVTPCFLFTMIFFNGVSCHKQDTLPVIAEKIPVPTTFHLNSIWFADSLRGSIAAGNDWQGGALLSTTDGGQTWQIDTTGERELSCVMYDRKGRAFACGLDGQALHRPPGARQWIPFRYDYNWYRSCFFWDETAGVVVGGASFGYGYSVNFGPGNFWEKDTLIEYPNELNTVWCTDKNTCFAAGYGWLMSSADGGHSWTRLPVTDDFFKDIHFPTPETGYLCGQYGSIWKTTDGGRNWTRLRKPLGRERFSAIWFTDTDTGWLVGDKGLLWHTSNGGQSWSAVSGIEGEPNLKGLFVDFGKGWVVGESGELWQFLP